MSILALIAFISMFVLLVSMQQAIYKSSLIALNSSESMMALISMSVNVCVFSSLLIMLSLMDAAMSWISIYTKH